MTKNSLDQLSCYILYIFSDNTQYKGICVCQIRWSFLSWRAESGFLAVILQKHLMLLESEVTVRFGSGLWTLAVMCVISAERCVEQPAGTYRQKKTLAVECFCHGADTPSQTDMFHCRVDGLSATLLDLNHQIFDWLNDDETLKCLFDNAGDSLIYRLSLLWQNITK